MKATMDLPDDLYRQVKAKSALEGRAVREVAVELFETYVAGPPAAPGQRPGAEARTVLADGKPAPAWFGLARKYLSGVEDHSLDAVRESIGRGWAQEVGARESALRKAVKR